MHAWYSKTEHKYGIENGNRTVYIVTIDGHKVCATMIAPTDRPPYGLYEDRIYLGQFQEYTEERVRASKIPITPSVRASSIKNSDKV